MPDSVVMGPPRAGWYRQSKPSGDSKLEEMRYSVEEINERDIHMMVPFVPYEHFQKSRAWRDGFSYVEYMEVLRDISCFCRHELYDVHERVCTDANGKERMPLWYLPTKAEVSWRFLRCTLGVVFHKTALWHSIVISVHLRYIHCNLSLITCFASKIPTARLENTEFSTKPFFIKVLCKKMI
jgi:hypothetical protein